MEKILEQNIIALLQKQEYLGHFIQQFDRIITNTIPTAGVGFKGTTLTLYINPVFWSTLTFDEQVAVLQHECIAGDTLIKTDKGDIKIKDIVNKRLDVKVLSLNKNGNLEYKEITQYSRKKLSDHPNKRFINLKLSESGFLFKRPRLTNDHMIAVCSDPLNPKIEYVKAEDSLGKYSVRLVDEVRERNKETPLYSDTQIQIMIGCLMGDSHMSKPGMMSTVASKKFKDYIEYKQKLLGGNISDAWSGYKKEFSNLRINHGVTAQTKILRELLYIDGKRSVVNILDKVTPISLAFWYMDDGHWNKHHALHLHSEGYSLNDNILLQKMFKDRFNIEAEIEQRNDKKHLYNLHLKKDNAYKFFELVSPYIHERMYYKIPESYRGRSKDIDFGRMSISLKKIIEIEESPSIKSDLYDIAVNDNHNFFAGNSLVHNCFHPLLGHLTRGKDYSDKKRANVAFDIALNQYIENLPKNAALPKPEWEKFREADYYFDLLNDEEMKKYGGSEEFDVHDWDDIPKELAEELVKHAANKAKQKTRGNLPANIENLLSKLNANSVDWKKTLRRYMSQSIKELDVNTKLKRNRRYGLANPGWRRESQLNIFIAVDVSGSVSDAYIHQFFSEIDNMASNRMMDIEVFEVDMQINQRFKYKKGQKINVLGRGGTDYNIFFEGIKKESPDLIIYLGDGESAPVLVKPKVPVIWGMMPNCTPPNSWGKIVNITLDGEKK